MGWTRKKEARLEYLLRAAIPLSLEDRGKVERLAELAGEVEKVRRTPDQTPAEVIQRLMEINGEHNAILDSLPEHWEERLAFTGEPEILDKALNVRQALQYEQDCELASEAKRKVLEDPTFLAACEKAGIPPTPRQASKWLRRRRGAANRAAGRIK